MTSLARAFGSGGSRKIKWQGQIVHAVYQLAVKTGDVIELTRLNASTARAQALNLAVDKGTLRANGVLMETAAVWTHTSPETAPLEVVDRKARTVDIWNAWSFDGVESAWLGSAGMVVDENGDELTLRCSDGLGDATFDDLVVKVVITHHE